MKKFLYRAVEGDSAESVAARFDVSVTRLIKDNFLTCEISAGDLLVVEKTGRLYRVGLGENYSSIANKFGISERELSLKNGDPPYFYYGQKINV